MKKEKKKGGGEGRRKEVETLKGRNAVEGLVGR